jgi:hypothetical protein
VAILLSRNTLKCLKTFFNVTIREKGIVIILISSGTRQGWRFTSQSPTTKNNLLTISIVPKLRNPDPKTERE